MMIFQSPVTIRHVAVVAALLVLIHLVFFSGLFVQSSTDAFYEYYDRMKCLVPPNSSSTILSPETGKEKSTKHLKPPETNMSIAFCSSVRDQRRDMPEWFIHHYYNIGIKHFYIMDDVSHPPLSTYDIDGYYGIPSEAITFTHFNEGERAAHGGMMQEFLNDECNRRWGEFHDWIAYFDVDEYIGLMTDETLQEILQPFTDDPAVGAFGMMWWMHTANGHLHRQPSVRRAYTECMSDRNPEGIDDEEYGVDNEHIKSMVKPSLYNKNRDSPHDFNTLNGSVTVIENGDVLPHWWHRPPVRDRVVLHHYIVKSEEEYAEKQYRGNQGGTYRTWEYWNHINYGPNEPCEDMLRWEI